MFALECGGLAAAFAVDPVRDLRSVHASVY
jgi:hypothetical protein